MNAITVFQQSSKITIEVARRVFFKPNPANGYYLPSLTGNRTKDEKRTLAVCGIIDWWREVSEHVSGNHYLEEERLFQLLNWASTALIDAQSAFNMPPSWNDRPVWGSLRTHARDGGGLTANLLERLASNLLSSVQDYRISMFRPENAYVLGLAWHWAILASAANRVLQGNMEVAEFQNRFMGGPIHIIAPEERRKVVEWIKNLKIAELERLTRILNTKRKWCKRGILDALEHIEDTEDALIQRAVKTLWEEGFEPLTNAVREGLFDISEILP